MVGALLMGVFLPVLAFADRGILLLADDGTPEWNGQVSQLAAAVAKQTPTEVAFSSATGLDAQPALDRLVQRGVSEIVVVPLFIGALPPDFISQVKSTVPLRISGTLNGDPVVSDIVLGRARAISTNPTGETLVLIAHGPGASGDRRWAPDLAVAAQRLNLTRAFPTILAMMIPPNGTVGSDRAAFRGTIERLAAAGRRILVVPVLTPYGAVEPSIDDLLQ
ncbi:MAG TPA: CbiX/SirB N-terminal domain-containing protein, partial [Vicinamibacterales bacterium]